MELTVTNLSLIHISMLPDYYFTPDKLEAYKDGNMLKGGIVFADAVTTVSQTYAEEIKMPFYGEGLDGLMRARTNSLRGIVNGIDYNEFNPATDTMIAQTYDARTCLLYTSFPRIQKRKRN